MVAIPHDNLPFLPHYYPLAKLIPLQFGEQAIDIDDLKIFLPRELSVDSYAHLPH